MTFSTKRKNSSKTKTKTKSKSRTKKNKTRKNMRGGANGEPNMDIKVPMRVKNLKTFYEAEPSQFKKEKNRFSTEFPNIKDTKNLLKLSGTNTLTTSSTDTISPRKSKIIYEPETSRKKNKSPYALVTLEDETTNIKKPTIQTWRHGPVNISNTPIKEYLYNENSVSKNKMLEAIGPDDMRSVIIESKPRRRNPPFESVLLAREKENLLRQIHPDYEPDIDVLRGFNRQAFEVSKQLVSSNKILNPPLRPTNNEKNRTYTYYK